jgi:ABC-type glycerol-3-phosphate transport system permease component
MTRHPDTLTPRHPRLGGYIQQAILLLASLVALFPLWFMVWSALRSQDDYFRSPLGWPDGIQWDNFSRAFDENIGRWIVNSAIVTGGAVLLVLLISVPAAYAFVRLPFRGSDLLLKIFVFLMVIPPIVMLLPLFALMNALGRVNHFDAVILAYAGLMFPFSVFMMVRYIETIPQDLYEAAFVEGASHLRILWTIVVPLLVPALLTLGIVNALWAWNELLIAVVMLQREEARTLQAGLALLKGKNTMDIPLVMAGATVSAIPLLLLYLFGQRVFMRGLLAGAVKE